MATSVTMSYGSFNFSPVPSFTYSRAVERTPGQDFCLSSPIEFTLEGLIVPTGLGGTMSGGFGPVTDQVLDLSNTFKCGSCETLTIACDGSNVVNAPAKVTNLNINPRNDGDLYVNTAAYSITLEIPSLSGDAYDNQPSGITAISEDWSYEIANERIGGTVDMSGVFNDDAYSFNVDASFNVTHNMSVTAPHQCKTGGGADIIGWEQAAQWVIDNLAVDTPDGGVTGLLLPSNLGYYNHFRSVSKNIFEGTIDVSDSWVATNNSGAIEDFTVSIDDNLDTYLRTIAINGTIQGLGSVTYPAATGTPKLKNAFDYWKTVSGSLYARAQASYEQNQLASDGGTRSLNNVPLSRSIGYNSVEGTVTYNYSFDDRPYNCVSNARAEKININETNPNDVFASVTVLGRVGGPLFQDINTIGPTVREISVEAILPPDTGCLVGGLLSYAAPTGYDGLVSGYEAYVTGSYENAFINNENKTWSPKDGRFTFTKSWTVGKCQ